MALFELTRSSIHSVPAASMALAGLSERRDLQRLLRDQIEVVAPGVKVVSEEFGTWSEGSRRLDLLGLDRDGNLVVLELKRTEDGGHMELQALRYAAMCSTMTFEQVVDAHAAYLAKRAPSDRPADARAAILGFLGWDSEDDGECAGKVRIVLVSADFSNEITTAVLWLNGFGLDIRCVRVKPYDLQGQLLVDVQQVVPLPEAADYQVKVLERNRRRGEAGAQPTMTELLRQIGYVSAESARLAEAIHDWAVEEEGLAVTTARNGFSIRGRFGGEDYLFVKINSQGVLSLRLESLKLRPGFSDETRRQELIDRANRLPGVEIGSDRHGVKPGFNFAVLPQPEAMNGFQELLRWMASVAAAAPLVVRGDECDDGQT